MEDSLIDDSGTSPRTGANATSQPDDLAVLHGQYDLRRSAPAVGRWLLRPLVAVLRRVLRPVLQPLLERQTSYNGANARLASELLHEVRSLRDELRAERDAWQERLQTGLDHTREAFELEHKTLVKEMRCSQHGLRGELATERHRQGQVLERVRDALIDQIERLAREQRAFLGGPGNDDRGDPAPPVPAPAVDGVAVDKHRSLSHLQRDVPSLAARFADGRNGSSDALLAALTRRLRGPEELITERLEVYLPYVREAAARAGSPVVEIGCGRGEWLKLLGSQDILARGVDSNPVMVEDCVAQGLSVVESEGLAHLRELPDASCAAVVAFHVIEHMPLEHVVELFSQARRVLAPGGLVIFETPNPANLVVGACNFYCDPTHVRPLPIPLARAFAEELGFSGVKILELHPDREHQLPDPETRLEQEVNRLFFGCKDYAVIGRR